MLSGRPLTMNPESAQDRRTMRRFDMRLPAAIQLGGVEHEFFTETQNVSARGVYSCIGPRDRDRNTG